jgi:hypothetical protein
MENVLNSVNVFVGRTYKDKADEVEPRPNGEFDRANISQQNWFKKVGNIFDIIK